MSKSLKELETRRRKLAFGDMRQDWWWLDPTHDNENDKCAAALAWETLRRTKSYPALWRKAGRERGAFLGNKNTANPVGNEAFRLMRLFQQAKDSVGELCWNYLINGFDPDKTWLELDERQRLTAQGCGIFGRKAVKISEAWTLPRQSANPPPGVVRVGICEIDRNGSSQLFISNCIRGCEPLAHVIGMDFFQRLTPCRYLFACFDSRRSREELLHAWDEEMKNWLGDPAPKPAESKRIAVSLNPITGKPTDWWTPDPGVSESRPMRGEVHLLPSNDPPFVILLVPARYNRRVFRSAFHGQLKKEQRDKWLPHCVQFWKTLTVKVGQFPRNPDGSKRIELDANGQPIREQVVKRLFNPKERLPQKERRRKSGARKNLWLGLAACDAVRADEPLGKSSAKASVLVEYCKESYPALSNHQRSAEAYLHELDGSLRRLDKKLAHWLRENTKLF